MKKPARSPSPKPSPTPPRVLRADQLVQAGGGTTAPTATVGNKTWSDDWLAPT